MLLRTSSLLHDERVLKEMNSLSEQDATVKAFVSENTNEAKSYSVCENANANSLKLKSYNKLGRMSVAELGLKALVKILSDKQPPGSKKIVWFHDPVMFVNIPLFYLFRKTGHIDKLVWDHHELPPSSITNSSRWRKIIGTLASKVDANIQANTWRKSYFLDKFLSGNKSLEPKIHVLRNYPGSAQEDSPEPSVVAKLADQPFIYIQSGFGDHRNYPSLHQALRKAASLPVVFSGSAPADVNFDDFPVPVIALGKVSPSSLPWFFRHAAFTVILYKSNFGINNHLCEPNRLFHAISNQLPAITGNNPPMREAIEKYSAGVILDDDGTDPAGLETAIAKMCAEYSDYKYSAPLDLQWDSQKDVLKTLVLGS